MIKYIYMALISFFFFISCVRKEKPEPVIPEKRLVNILKDLMIIEAGINRAFDPKLNKDSLATPYYLAVYQKHGVTFAQFMYSYKQYQKEPEFMDSLFVKVLEQLQIEQAEFEVKNKRIEP